MAAKPKTGGTRETGDVERGNYLPVESGPGCREICQHIYPKLVMDCGQVCMIAFGVIGIMLALVVYLCLWFYIGYWIAGLFGIFVAIIPAIVFPIIIRWLYVRYRDGMHELQAIRIGTELQEVGTPGV